MKLTALVLGIVLGVFIASFSHTSYDTQKNNIQVLSSLEKAVKASMFISYQYRTITSTRTSWGGGSATLISRLKKNNVYQYRALTAYHVIQRMQTNLQNRGTRANREMILTIQENWHGQPIDIRVQVKLDWMVPKLDWSTFTFESTRYLECVQLATRKEFKQIKPGEEIYGIGGDNGQGLLLRKGIIGATHTIYPSHIVENSSDLASSPPWRQYPDAFFRPFTPVWFGASGGGIFNKYGKLIGLYNAINITYFQPVAHGAIALKTYRVLELANERSKDFFVIEENQK